MAGKYRTLLNNTGIFAIGTIGSRLITFLLVPLYTNYLTTSQYGTADLIMNLSFLVIPAVSLVFQDAILRFGLAKSIDIGKVAKSTAVVFGLCSLVALLFTPLYSYYPAIAEWRWYLTVLVITGCLNNFLLSYAKAKEMNKLYSFSSVLSALMLAALNILLLVIFDFGVKGFLLGNIFANLLLSFVLLLCTKIFVDMRDELFDYSLTIEMIKYSAPLVVSNISWWVVNSSDRVMVEHYLSTSHLGLYTAASKIPSLLTVFISIFSSAWIISAIKEYESDKDTIFYENVFRLFSLVICVGASVVISIIKPFMTIYVGSEFYSAWRLAPVLVVGAVFFSFASFFGAIYGSAKKNVLVTISTLLGALVNIIVNVLLIPLIGVLGASVSTAIGYGMIALFRFINSRSFFSFYINYSKLICNCLVIIFQAIMVTAFENATAYSYLFILLIIAINLEDIKLLKSFVKSIISNRSILDDG